MSVHVCLTRSVRLMGVRYSPIMPMSTSTEAHLFDTTQFWIQVLGGASVRQMLYTDTMSAPWRGPAGESRVTEKPHLELSTWIMIYHRSLIVIKVSVLPVCIRLLKLDL